MNLMHGVPFSMVTIVPNEANRHLEERRWHFAGCIKAEDGQMIFHSDRKFVSCIAGGVLAERIFRGLDKVTINTIRNWFRYGFALQHDIYALVTDETFRDDKRALLHRVEYTASLLRLPSTWQMVEAVAQALLARGTLTSDDVDVIAHQVYGRAGVHSRGAVN